MVSASFLIDGMLSGTGIRDAINGGYVEPETLSLTAQLIAEISSWVTRYENAHYAGFPIETVSELDREGIKLTIRVSDELPNVVVGYFSNGLMKRLQ